jgi:hypothetical protein
MIYDITQAGIAFTCVEKRAILFRLNIRVMIYPRRHEPRYTMSEGRHGGMKLPLEIRVLSDCIVKAIQTAGRLAKEGAGFYWDRDKRPAEEPV